MNPLETPEGAEAVARIYAAALDARQWPETVAALTAWTGGEIGCLQLRRSHPQAGISVVTSGIDPVFESAYVQHYHQLDPHLKCVVQLQQGRTLLSREVVSDEELFRSEFYNDFFRPQGVCDLQGAMLIRQPSRVVTFATQSSVRARFDEHTRARLDALVPHLTRAVEFTLREEELVGTQQVLLAAIQAQQSGLLRVNASLSILEASDHTLTWLSLRSGALSARDGQLLASDPDDAERLRACVRATLTQSSARCVLNADRRESVTLVVSPAAPTLLHPEPGAFIFFSVHPRGTAHAAPANDRLDALPPALRRVAESLQLGLSDKEIAERLQLPLVTARTYVSRTLRRLGVKSRRQLIARR